jgi:thiol-disulfide isomerase/thioredoxin
MESRPQDIPYSNVIVLVFVMEGCPHCKEYMPKFQVEASKHPSIPVRVLDANAEGTQATADRLGVISTPTTYVLRRGPGMVKAEGDLDGPDIAYLFGLAERCQCQGK